MLPSGPLGGNTGGAPPKIAPGQRFIELGNSGLRQYSGFVREEFLPQLQGRQAARVYREMMDNSDAVGAIMFAILGVMRKAAWRVVPAQKNSAEAKNYAEFADGLRDDMSVPWEDFIMEVLSMLGYGYSIHEIVYKRRKGPQPERGAPGSKYDDGLIGIRRLPIRGQDTVLKWFFGAAGETLGFTQQPYAGPLVDLPIEKCLLFRPLRHKNSPEGRSVLRNAYRKYYFVKRLEEQEAILFERMSGLPVMRIPSAVLEAAGSGNADAVAALNSYKALVSNVRVDEQMGLVIPSDTYLGPNGPTAVPMYEFKLETPSSGRANLDAHTPIMRHTQGIFTSILADFIQMGHTSRGAQNLAETKVDLFMQSVEGWLNSIASVLNKFLLPRVWRLNAFPMEMLPTYNPEMAQRIDLGALSTYFADLAQAGMPLFPDGELEKWLREVAGAPERIDEAEHAAAQEAALVRAGGMQRDTGGDGDAQNNRADQNSQDKSTIP
ncbi:MAG: phage portal protein family protein [Methylocella sp.]